MGITGYDRSFYQDIHKISHELERIADLLEVGYIRKTLTQGEPVFRESRHSALVRLENKLWPK